MDKKKDFLKDILILILSAIVGAAALFLGANFIINPVYRSTTSFYVITQEEDGPYYTQDYINLIKTRTVMEKAKALLDDSYDVDTMLEKTSAEAAPEGHIIYISFDDENPKYAKLAADAIRVAAGEEIAAVTDAVNISPVDEAHVPTSRYILGNVPAALLGAAGGFLIALIVIIIIGLVPRAKKANPYEKYRLILPEEDDDDEEIDVNPEAIVSAEAVVLPEEMEEAGIPEEVSPQEDVQSQTEAGVQTDEEFNIENTMVIKLADVQSELDKEGKVEIYDDVFIEIVDPDKKPEKRKSKVGKVTEIKLKDLPKKEDSEEAPEEEEPEEACAEAEETAAEPAEEKDDLDFEFLDV